MCPNTYEAQHSDNPSVFQYCQDSCETRERMGNGNCVSIICSVEVGECVSIMDGDHLAHSCRDAHRADPTWNFDHS